MIKTDREPEPCEGEYCAIDLYHQWVSEARGEAMMGAVTQGYSMDGGHPHEAANEAVRGTAPPKPCSLCTLPGRVRTPQGDLQ